MDRKLFRLLQRLFHSGLEDFTLDQLYYRDLAQAA